jgi:hypothetical protein
MSRKRKIWVVASLVAALLVLIPLGLRWRAQWNLNAYRKKLIASGEKLTVEELAPKRDPQATNTVAFLKLASALSPLWDNAPGAMRLIKPGVARVAWRQSRCLERTDDSKPSIDVWPAFTDAVRTNEPAIDELQARLNAGGVEFVNEWNQQNLYEQTILHSVMYLVVDLGASAMLMLHEERMQEAYRYLKSSGTIIQLAEKDTTMIEQLTAYAIVSIEFVEFWEALQSSGWTDEQLDHWQHQWEQANILVAAESSLAMERARGPMIFQVARNSRQELAGMQGEDSGIKSNFEILDDLLLHLRKGVSELLTTYPRYWGWRWIWSYKDEQRYLEIMQATIEKTRDLQKRRSMFSPLKDGNASVPRQLPKTNNFGLAGPLTASNEAFVKQALRAQTMANVAIAAIALERFRLAHHAYPAALANLTPEFIQAIPVDCMDGHDLRYRLNPDGTYLLYSVGEDGVDDEGDATPVGGKKPGFLNGRDWVWPRAATDEEVQAYEAEQNKPKAGGKR